MIRTVLIILVAALTAATNAIEIGDFFRPAQAVYATMSPDGNRVAIAENVEHQLQIIVHDLSSNERRVVFDARKLLDAEESALVQLRWLDSQSVAIVLSEDREGVAELLNTRRRTNTYIVQTGDEDNTVFEVQTSGTIVNALPSSAGAFLYGRSGFRSSVFQISVDKLNQLGTTLTRRTRIDGGQFSASAEVASFDGFVFRWFFDQQGAVSSVFAIDTMGRLKIAKVEDDGTWSSLKEWPDIKTYADSDDRFFPLALGADSDEYIVLVSKEGQTDGLFRERLSSGERTLVYRHPTADIFEVFQHPGNTSVHSIGTLDKGNVRFVYLQDDLGDAAEELEKKLPDTNIRVIDRGPNGGQYLVSAFGYDRPMSFYAWQRADGELQGLGDAMPWLEQIKLAKPISDSVVSHDLEIPYLLTLPIEGTAPYPLVLLPHGGPIGVADQNIYDPTAQLLAHNGYAVLQVNYRGSAGYGDDFLNAGKKQWGIKIIDDILAAFEEAIQRPDIDAQRACAVGGSYGGYAALRIGILNPQKFRCIVSVAGVTDVALLTADPNQTDDKRDWVAEFIGNPETDFDELAEISPLAIADQSEIPILLLHGDRDTVVDAEHAYRMAHALEAYGKTYELHVLPDMYHTAADPEEATEVFSTVLRFLSESLE